MEAIQQLIIQTKDTADVRQTLRFKGMEADVDDRYVLLKYRLSTVTVTNGVETPQESDYWIRVTDNGYQVKVYKKSDGTPVFTGEFDLDNNPIQKTIGEFTNWHLGLFWPIIRPAVEAAAKAAIGLIPANEIKYFDPVL